MGLVCSVFCFDDAVSHIGIGKGQAIVLPYAQLGLFFSLGTQSFVRKEMIV